MATAADISARIEKIAARLRVAPVRSKVRGPLGPRRIVVDCGEKFDRLECGHVVAAISGKPGPRRCCIVCYRLALHGGR